MFIRPQSLLRTCLIGLLALSILTACVPPPASPAFSPLSPIATPVPPDTALGTAVPEQPMLTSQPVTAVPGATPVLQPGDRDLALADLAAHLGIEADAITVSSVEQVEWNAASLGCPKPGMMYAQVITPGYRIVLETDGKSYEYHTGGGGTVVRCKP